jgi:hypothetical protein
MDFDKMLSELRNQKGALDQAILALERLALGGGKKRGRPRKTEAALEELKPVAEVKVRRRKARSPEARAKMAESQRKRWEAWKKAQAEQNNS